MSIHKPRVLHAGTGRPSAVNSHLKGFSSLGEFRREMRMRSLTPFPDNAQREFDNVAIDVGLDRLAIVRRLIERGLTYPLPNWLGVPELYWERRSRVGHARRTMTPGSEPNERQKADRSGVTYPIYATEDGFSFHAREIEIGARAGTPIDTEGAEAAVRNVNEAIEDAAINGGVTVGGNSSPGFLGAPNVNTVTYEDGPTAWDDATKTGANILTDVIAMANALKADNYYGPYELFIPTDYENKLNEDYSAQYPRTIRSRLEELEFGGENLVITVADMLPDDRTIMFQATRDVVDVVQGQSPTFVGWQGMTPWLFEFNVLACQIVRVKDNYDGGSGIVTGNV